MSVDNKRARSIQDTFGHLQTVFFGPEDIAISKGSASYRRTFIDRSVFQTQPSFYETIRSFESALKNRNALLKEMQQGRSDQGMLEVFDQQLIEQGSTYIYHRLQFLKRFKNGFKEIHDHLCRGQHSVDIEYESTLGVTEDFALGDIATAFASKLESDRGRDRARGFTSSGPHVDDILLSVDQHPARIHASQGQHRTLVLALKIGEISHLHQELGYRPILLLDDVSSELDRSRNQQLMEFLLEKSGQVFITTTDPTYIALNTEALLLCMDKGELKDLR
jgi:DNA replication and repair protein RecF